MKWTTLIEAINPKTKELCLWMGPLVDGETQEAAQQWCDENDLGYCRVDARYVEEIDEKLSEFASRLLDDSINN